MARKATAVAHAKRAVIREGAGARLRVGFALRSATVVYLVETNEGIYGRINYVRRSFSSFYIVHVVYFLHIPVGV